LTADEKSVRRLLTKLTYEDAKLVTEIRYADMKAHAEQYAFSRDYTEKVISLIDFFEKTGECVNLKTLAVTGDDLLDLGIPKGKKIGEILNALLENVVENNIPNEKKELLARAKELI
jgi:tRNA nucleotidyltransferase (CCA-adding enzyme)